MNSIIELARLDKKLLHTNDLELLWGIKNKQTLYSRIGRYVKSGILVPIYRGFYSTVPIAEVDIIELGSSSIHDYCYLSTESVLAQNGIILQAVPNFTYCSTKNKNISIKNHTFVSRQLKDDFLFNQEGIISQKNYKIASTERAIADLLYFNPKYHFDGSAQIDWEKVGEIQRKVGYK